MNFIFKFLGLFQKERRQMFPLFFYNKNFYIFGINNLKTLFMDFKSLYWWSMKDHELRRIISDPEHLEHYRKGAAKELVRRTTDYSIDDLQG